MILWIMELEATELVSTLDAKVTAHMPTAAKPRACVNNPGSQSIYLNSGRCKQPSEAMMLTCKTLQDRFRAVPPFSQFMKGKRQRGA